MYFSPLTGHNLSNSVCLGCSPMPSHGYFIYFIHLFQLLSVRGLALQGILLWLELESPSLLTFLFKIQCIILTDDKISPNLSDGSLFKLVLVKF